MFRRRAHGVVREVCAVIIINAKSLICVCMPGSKRLDVGADIRDDLRLSLPAMATGVLVASFGLLYEAITLATDMELIT